jgi:hypothetical protein
VLWFVRGSGRCVGVAGVGGYVVRNGETGRRGLGGMGQSLRDSPLRGGKSREAVASREESDSESTRSPRSTSLLLQRNVQYGRALPWRRSGAGRPGNVYCYAPADVRDDLSKIFAGL